MNVGPHKKKIIQCPYCKKDFQTAWAKQCSTCWRKRHNKQYYELYIRKKPTNEKARA